MIDIQTLIPEVIAIAKQAGMLIMQHYHKNTVVEKKGDSSPVTEADREADRFIVRELNRITPEIPTVSEEGQKPEVAGAPYFWLIDPLDGTKSFIRGTGYFTVNIALIHNENEPLLGVIYEPVAKTLYYGSNAGAFKEEYGQTKSITMRPCSPSLTAIVSHSHLDAKTEHYLQENHITDTIPCASSIKFCFLAEGKADVYPRFGPTMEWDIAAGHAILKAAGGRVLTPEGEEMGYGKQGFLNGNFIAKKR